MSKQLKVFLVFALALHRLANANSSVFVVDVSCSLSTYSLSIKSVTNLFRPWESLTHEWEKSLFADSIQFPLRIYLAGNWLWLPTRVQFRCSLESNLLVQLIFHLVVKFLTTCHWLCKLQELVSMFCHQVLSDFNCFQESCISINFEQSIWLWKPFHSFLVLLQ